jgi:hypothetical protein
MCRGRDRKDGNNLLRSGDTPQTAVRRTMDESMVCDLSLAAIRFRSTPAGLSDWQRNPAQPFSLSIASKPASTSRDLVVYRDLG